MRNVILSSLSVGSSACIDPQSCEGAQVESFTLNFENYFVPAENLVGDEEGLGRGFYLQMAGFAAGRLQTGGRACGLAM